MHTNRANQPIPKLTATCGIRTAGPRMVEERSHLRRDERVDGVLALWSR